MDVPKVDTHYANPLARLAMEPATPRTPGTLPPCPGDLKQTPRQKQWIQEVILLPNDLEDLDECLDDCLTDSYREHNPLAQSLPLHTDGTPRAAHRSPVTPSAAAAAEAQQEEDDLWAGLDDDYDLQALLRDCEHQLIEDAYVESGMNR